MMTEKTVRGFKRVRQIGAVSFQERGGEKDRLTEEEESRREARRSK